MSTIQSLPTGKNSRLLDESPTAAGILRKPFTTDAETVLVFVYATSISGTMTVKAYTYVGHESEDKNIEVIDFGTLTGSEANTLIVKKSGAITQQMFIEVETDDAAEYQVWVRGVSTGETSVKILGSDNATASQTNVGTTPVALIPSSLTDRDGTVVKNNNSAAGILYLGFTVAETTAANGYPLGVQEALGIDVAAGVTIYGVADAGTIDVRILESGG